MVEQFTYFNSVKQSTISISFEKVDYFTFWLGRLFYKVDQNVVPLFDISKGILEKTRDANLKNEILI